jgi:hypothetical protein
LKLSFALFLDFMWITLILLIIMIEKQCRTSFYLFAV